MADGVSTAVAEEEERQRPPSDLERWSTRVEDLVDGGDVTGSAQLLEKVVESLRIRSDAATNLELAAALNDLGRIYADQGLSLKSDDVLNSSLLIKQRRAQKPVDSWEDKIDDLSQNGSQHAKSAASPGSTPNARDLHEYDQFQRRRDFPGELSIAGATEEEDWETALNELPTPLKASSPAISKLQSNEKTASKQRGRGSFTYGGVGMYSDSLEVTAEDSGPGNSSDQSDNWVDGEASHVLVLAFSPQTKMKDLENLVKPFSNEGSCSIRWVDDTQALAVFSSPVMARAALAGIKDAKFKVSLFIATSEISGNQASMKDLAPPGPRPASSARVAQRMIANALSKQGVNRELLVKSKGSVREIQKQERQRKERLQARSQLRDEAWGSDEE